MTIDEAIYLIRQRKNCSNARFDCEGKSCSECENNYDSIKLGIILEEEFENWLVELKAYREIADKFKKLVDNSPFLKGFIEMAEQKIKEQDNNEAGGKE